MDDATSALYSTSDIARDCSRRSRLYAPIVVALGTGLRRGELLGLRRSDLDLDKAMLTVAQSLEQTKPPKRGEPMVLRFEPPKTKRGRRTIALSPSVVEVLRKHRVERLEQRVPLGLGRGDPGGLVLRKLDGEPFVPDLFTQEFARIVAKAEIRPITFHGLPHSPFTSLPREGIHPKIASERAGHASVAITLDVYSHAVPGLQEDAALRIDASLRDVLGR